MPFEPVIGLEIHAQLLTATKIFCGVLHRLRRAAEHARVPGVPRPAGRPAGAQRRAPWSSRSGRRSRSAAPCTRGRSSRGRTTSTRTCRRATRSRSTTSRWPPAASCRGDSAGGRVAVRITRVHLEEDAGKSLHEGLAGLGRTTRTSTSTAAACRSSRSSREPDLRSAEQSRGVLHPAARDPRRHRRQRRQHGGGQPALRRQRLGAAGRAGRRSAPRPR